MKTKQANQNQKNQALKNKLGQTGEKIAADFLKKNGYQILAKNFHALKKEIDLIAHDLTQDEIVFVEVKTRHSAHYGHPALAVDKKKLHRIQTAAWIYLKQYNLAKNFRFDIIAVLPNKVEHFKNVSWEI